MTEPNAAVFLTTKDIAARWRTTPKGFAQLRHRGLVPAAVKIGGRLLYRLEDVIAFEEAAKEDRRGVGVA
jgi:hypothetical protein